MLHTTQFCCQLQSEEIHDLTRRFNVSADLLSKEIDEISPGITIALKERSYDWSMYIYVDFIKLLGKADISEKDFVEAMKEINRFKQFVFGNDRKEIILTRIDYRFDVVVKDKKHRQLFLKLYRKSYEKYRFKKKNARYKTSLYFNSKSINIIVYDKEEERKAKSQIIEPYEMDVLRFEVRLLNPHLNYKKRRKNFEKTLESYMRESTWKDYMLNQLSPFFKAGSFCKINMAEKIIADSGLGPKEREGLREFLCDVSIHGFKNMHKLEKTAVSGEKIQKYSKYLIKKRLHQLNELDINPLLIPKHTEIDLGGERKIENPLTAIFAGV